MYTYSYLFPTSNHLSQSTTIYLLKRSFDFHLLALIQFKMIFYYKTYAQIAVIDFMDCIRIQQSQQEQ